MCSDSVRYQKYWGWYIVWKETHLEWQQYCEQETKRRHLYPLLRRYTAEREEMFTEMKEVGLIEISVEIF